ncbi:MAG: amidohydrolase family protein [Armatimonadetes bacterium]|nr:amidohydrolase family protein [Armatimonadota bacterium]
MILRPDALVLPGGRVESGLEVCIADGRIERIRPWSGATREETDLLLSLAFVNAHSHLEYYDLMGQLDGLSYWDWIQSITEMKPKRTIETVQLAAILAARRNVRTGVAAVGEISDWPVSGRAMKRSGLSGRVFQEVITLKEYETPGQKLALARERARKNADESGLPVHLSAHAAYSVTAQTLRDISRTGEPNSIHVSESVIENQFFLRGEGPIAEMYDRAGLPFEPPGCTCAAYLDSLGALHKKTQIVHACDLTPEDISIAAERGVTAAHCPRSNRALGCPPAPVAELRRRGVKVGLGMDSAASSGPIDTFAEMRAALKAAQERGDPLTPQDVWTMATEEAAESIWLPREWRIAEGAGPDLILIDHSGARDLQTLIEHGGPARIHRMIRLTASLPKTES